MTDTPTTKPTCESLTRDNTPCTRTSIRTVAITPHRSFQLCRIHETIFMEWGTTVGLTAAIIRITEGRGGLTRLMPTIRMTNHSLPTPSGVCNE